MVVRRIARWSIIVTAIAICGVRGRRADGQSCSRPRVAAANLRAACGQDARRFLCRRAPGGGRIVQCLSSHNRELSVGVREHDRDNTSARRSTPDPNAQSPSALPAAPSQSITHRQQSEASSEHRADRDAKALRGARRESDVLKCLESQRMKLSTTCSSYFQNLGARPTAQKNIPEQKAAVAATNDAPRSKPPGNNNPPEPGPGCYIRSTVLSVHHVEGRLEGENAGGTIPVSRCSPSPWGPRRPAAGWRQAGEPRPGAAWSTSILCC